MLYSFQIVASEETQSPEQAFFDSLVDKAKIAAANEVLDDIDAWNVCEYLDAVDGGDVPMDRALYTTLVEKLGRAMLADQRVLAPQLARKSWAAKTVQELLLSVGDLVYCEAVSSAA